MSGETHHWVESGVEVGPFTGPLSGVSIIHTRTGRNTQLSSRQTSAPFSRQSAPRERAGGWLEGNKWWVFGVFLTARPHQKARPPALEVPGCTCGPVLAAGARVAARKPAHGRIAARAGYGQKLTARDCAAAHGPSTTQRQVPRPSLYTPGTPSACSMPSCQALPTAWKVRIMAPFAQKTEIED